MKKTIYKNDFIKAFEDYGRGKQFSDEGFTALFDYFTQYEEETGQEIELDVIAICTGFDEYSSFEEFQESYPDVKSLEEIYENFTIIPVKQGFIFPNHQ